MANYCRAVIKSLRGTGTISEMAVQSFSVRSMCSKCSTWEHNMENIIKHKSWPTMQAVTIMTGSSSSTRDCKIGNNITHGRPWSFHQNNGLHMLNQRLQYGEQYQTWRSTLSSQNNGLCSTRDCITGNNINMVVHAFPVRSMGATCSTRDCKIENNIKHGWPSDHAPFAELWAPRAQPENVIWEQYQTWQSSLFQSEQWPPRAHCSTRDCNMGNNIKHGSPRFSSQNNHSTCSTRDCNIGNNIRNGGPHFSSQNNGLYVLNQRLQCGTISKMVMNSIIE